MATPQVPLLRTVTNPATNEVMPKLPFRGYEGSAHYRVKRDLLCEALEEGGYEYPVPEGAFYIFAKTPGDESEFVERARQNLLLVVAGSDFGSPGHFRMSYAAPESTVRLACRKLRELAPSRSPEPALP